MSNPMSWTPEPLGETEKRLPLEALETIIEKQRLYIEHLETCLQSQTKIINVLLSTENISAKKLPQ